MRIAVMLCTAALLGILLGEGRAAAQPGTAPGTWSNPKADPAPVPFGYPAGSYSVDGQPPLDADAATAPYRFWARPEALAWWTKGSDLPPLLTTGDTGTLGQPGTRILFGDEKVDDDVRAGGRILAGYWLNDCQTCGIEGTFFALQQRNTTFNAASDANGNPVLGRPFFNVLENRQDALLISFPGLVSGSADIRTTSNVFGGDLYLRKNVCKSCCSRVDLLGGYRFLHLDEGLDINEVEISIDPEGVAPVGTRFDLTDTFDTRNNFHGGELGIIADYQKGCWTLQLVAKVALGVNERNVDINGVTRVRVPGGGDVLNRGGFLALPSNIGSHDDNHFSIVPEVGLNLQYQICRNLRLQAGYTFIYWTDVVRPGDQVDLAINTTQVPPGTLAGPARPAFNFNDSDFWVQGVSLGLEWRY